MRPQRDEYEYRVRLLNGVWVSDRGRPRGYETLEGARTMAASYARGVAAVYRCRRDAWEVAP